MTAIGDGPAIYIGFWGLYNDANLYGNWVDLTVATTADEINQCIDFLRNRFGYAGDPRCEEWMVRDHQNLPRCLHGENPDLDKLEEFLTALEEIGPDNIEIYLMAAITNIRLSTPIFQSVFMGSISQRRIFVKNSMSRWATT